VAGLVLEGLFVEVLLLYVAAWSQSGGLRARAECPVCHVGDGPFAGRISPGGTMSRETEIAGIARYGVAARDITNRSLISP
jgi:hypothetical protein